MPRLSQDQVVANLRVVPAIRLPKSLHILISIVKLNNAEVKLLGRQEVEFLGAVVRGYR